MLWAGLTGHNRWLIADPAAEIRCHCRVASPLASTRMCSTQKSDLCALKLDLGLSMLQVRHNVGLLLQRDQARNFGRIVLEAGYLLAPEAVTSIEDVGIA
jgi:hypothetical protein